MRIVDRTGSRDGHPIAKGQGIKIKPFGFIDISTISGPRPPEKKRATSLLPASPEPRAELAPKPPAPMSRPAPAPKPRPAPNPARTPKPPHTQLSPRAIEQPAPPTAPPLPAAPAARQPYTYQGCSPTGRMLALVHDCCLLRKVSIEALCGNGRDPEVVRTRMIISYIMRVCPLNFAHAGYAQIAAVLGRPSHTTIFTAMRRMERPENEPLRREALALAASLGHFPSPGDRRLPTPKPAPTSTLAPAPEPEEHACPS